MRTYRIAVFPGDGIGPEVIDQAVRVLEAVAGQQNTAQQDPGQQKFAFAWTRLPWGVQHWEETGRMTPPDFLEVLRPFDAILLGALGWPAKVSDHVTLAPLV